MKSWQLQDAKAHLSQVAQAAIHDGPQEISLRGEPAVVVMPIDEMVADFAYPGLQVINPWQLV